MIDEIEVLTAQARAVACNRYNSKELIEATIDALVARVCQIKDEEKGAE